MKYDKKKSKIWGALFQTLAKQRKKKNIFYKTGRIFASSAGTKCEQKLRFDFEGKEQRIDFWWHGHEATIGDAVHDALQKDWKNHFGDKIEIETYRRITIEGIRINAKIDAILHKPNEDIILEIKTCKDNEGKELKHEHFMQAQFYMGISKINKAVVPYFKRSNGTHINSFEIEFDKDIFDAIVDKITRVIKNEDLIHNKDECKYCCYKHICSHF